MRRDMNDILQEFWSWTSWKACIHSYFHLHSICVLFFTQAVTQVNWNWEAFVAEGDWATLCYVGTCNLHSVVRPLAIFIIAEWRHCFIVRMQQLFPGASSGGQNAYFVDSFCILLCQHFEYIGITFTNQALSIVSKLEGYQHRDATSHPVPAIWSFHFKSRSHPFRPSSASTMPHKRCYCVKVAKLTRFSVFLGLDKKKMWPVKGERNHKRSIWQQRTCKLTQRHLKQGWRVFLRQGIRSLMNMLDQMTSWIEDAPPQPQSNQRFGNLAFRTYNKLLQEVSCFSHRISANIDGRDYLRSLIHGISLPTFVLNWFLYWSTLMLSDTRRD